MPYYMKDPNRDVVSGRLLGGLGFQAQAPPQPETFHVEDGGSQGTLSVDSWHGVPLSLAEVVGHACAGDRVFGGSYVLPGKCKACSQVWRLIQ